MSSALDYPSIQVLTRDLKSLVDGTEDEVISNRSTALDLARRITEALETPQHAISQSWLMPNTVSCTKIAVDLDIFNILAQDKSKARTAADIGQISGAEPQLIVRIMRVLTALGYAKEVGESTYACTPKGEAMTKATNVAGLKHAFNINFHTTVQLPAYLQANQYKNPNTSSITPFQYAHKTKASEFEYMQQHPAIADNFNTLMQGVRNDRPNWIDWFPVREQLLEGVSDDADAVLMIDVGGGKGHDLVAFSKKFPNARGRMMLQDQQHVVASADLDYGLDKMAHNIFDPQPLKGLLPSPFQVWLCINDLFAGARLYFEHFVLHDWDDEKSVRILKNIALAMKPGYSKLYLNEWILPNVGCSLFEATMDVQLMLALAGMERTKSQWRELLQRAGLKLVKFWLPEGFGEGIVEASL